MTAEEEAVAGGATGDAVADERLFAGQAQPAGACAGGDDQRAGVDFAGGGLQLDGVGAQVN